ncbi:hypothetical protein [Streptomyces xylophagus]|uniref:hypothetical protein n=1 Tax=Streptomyces xylophagus TaxID=285514 RepID=UPI0005BBB8F4|nr:hypothetical protein [Streptomyces xylophagus]
MTTPLSTHRDRLAGHLVQVDNWALGAEFDVREFERQIEEAERNLANAARQFSMADVSARAVLGGGPDSVTFSSDVDRQVAALLAAIEMRANRTNLQAARETLSMLKAKQANAKTTLLQAQALRKRLQLAAEADELPRVTDELEALLED